MKETELFLPLKTYFEAQGYKISAEVLNTDMVLERDGEYYGLELKKKFSIDLVYQLLRRRGVYDGLYAAIGCEKGKVPRLRDVKMLLSSLGFGLIVVNFMRKGSRVEILLQANRDSGGRVRKQRRSRVIREISGRYAELNQAGVPGNVYRMGAYRQQCLMVLKILIESEEPLSPKAIRAAGAPERSQILLSQNIYGWFDRISRGLYQASQAGQEAAKAHSSFLDSLS